MATPTDLDRNHTGSSGQDPAAQAPVHRLPLETLEEILVAAVGHDPLDENGRNGLVGMMLTCRTWRNAALASRAIWANIELDIVQVTTARHQQGALHWLGRAGGLPKTVKICPPSNGICCSRYTHYSNCPWSNSTLGSILNAIGPTLYQLILLQIPERSFGQLVEQLDLPSSSWSAVKHLTISFGFSSQDHRSLSTLPTNLSSLVLNGSTFASDPMPYLQAISLDTYRNVTELSIMTGRLPLEALQLCTLNRCPLKRLRLCELTYVSDWEAHNPGPTTSNDPGFIFLPHLEFLDLTLWNANPDFPDLRRLQLPKLESLRVELRSTHQRQSQKLLDALLYGSPGHTPPLRSFFLRQTTPHLSWWDLEAILASGPSLEHLALEGDLRTLDFLGTQPKRSETSKSTTFPGWSLNTFELYDLSKAFDAEPLCEFLRRRLGEGSGIGDAADSSGRSGGGLKRVDLHHTERPIVPIHGSFDDLPSVKSIREEYGVVITRFY